MVVNECFARSGKKVCLAKILGTPNNGQGLPPALARLASLRAARRSGAGIGFGRRRRGWLAELHLARTAAAERALPYRDAGPRRIGCLPAPRRRIPGAGGGPRARQGVSHRRARRAVDA